ncbi:hypothetical protein JD969_17725 [Planctomycetota bacterium]|nr:hypothetical protein JD969_17725 [Planctomycetota bacterium]
MMWQRSSVLKVAAIALAVSVTNGTTVKVYGQMISPIIHDPTNGIQLIESVRESVQKAVKMVQQIDQLTRQLKSLAHLRMPGVGEGFGDVNSALNKVKSQAGDLGKYPTEFSGALTNAQMVEMDQLASKAVRDFAEKVKDAAGQIEQDRQAVSDRIQDIISASNAADGEKSGLQAHNHLLSVLAVEQSKLGAIRSLRSRLAEEIRAREQSRQALIQKYNEQAVESTKALSGE